jgi:hypothetical protein
MNKDVLSGKTTFRLVTFRSLVAFSPFRSGVRWLGIAEGALGIRDLRGIPTTALVHSRLKTKVADLSFGSTETDYVARSCPFERLGTIDFIPLPLDSSTRSVDAAG